MKKTISALYFLVLLGQLGAQTTIMNHGFENWQNVGSATEEPTQWNSIKTGSGNSTAISFAPQSCFRESNNPHSGMYCVRLVTGSVAGNVAPGSLTTGRLIVPSFDPKEGYIHSIAGSTDFAMPFNGRPDSIVFWVRYNRAGNDYPSISAYLHVGNIYVPEQPYNNNHPDSSVNIIARAQWNGPASSISSWTRYAVPFVYVDGRTPQYILITATPTANSSPTTAGSTLWIDDMGVVYNPTIATGTVTAGPYYVSASMGAAIAIPFTLTGSFGSNNLVTAQLSDASGSFASPINIGSVNATTSGVLNATIPAGTPTGNGYRVRVVSSNPNLVAQDNGSDLSVVLVSSMVTPTTSQNIMPNTNGATLTVMETPAASSREWKYSTTSGTGYQSFATPQTGTSYTPNFANIGVYYIVCISQIQGHTVISNEVQVTVSLITLSTGQVSTTLFEFSPQAPDGLVDVPFAVSAPFDSGNVFTAQLSDANGSFVYPLNIGTLAGVASGTISATIPSSTPSGTGYRIRVVGSSPQVFGSDNGTDITIDQFSNSISPAQAQTILVNNYGNPLTVYESQLVTSRKWNYTITSGSNYQPFVPAETGLTYTPYFSQAGTYYVVCISENIHGDEVISNEVAITVTVGTGIKSIDEKNIRIWNSGEKLLVDLTTSTMNEPKMIIADQLGKKMALMSLQAGSVNMFHIDLPAGVYLINIFDQFHTCRNRLMIR